MMAKWDYLQKATNKEIVEGVMDKPSSAKSPDDSKKPKKEVEEISIRKVENGFVATIRYKDRKEKNKDGETHSVYEEPTTRIVKLPAEVPDLLEEFFGD